MTTPAGRDPVWKTIPFDPTGTQGWVSNVCLPVCTDPTKQEEGRICADSVEDESGENWRERASGLRL